ncbi:unnamed protein product [Rotaria sp. Silwood2]|nr:unnamed protein product [Rotaria sp. Silwood2]CAF4633447.1 unnamed protein product [Rotaria sp. Silwood2]
MLKRIDSLSSRSQSVSSEFNFITPTSINKKFISEIYNNKKLEEELALIKSQTCIDLSYWNLIDHDIFMIIKQIITYKQSSNLINNSTLKCLDLSYNHISDRGIYFLSQVLLPIHYSSLEILFLNKNGISNDGIHYLSEMLQTNQTLTELWLSDNEIGDEGIKQLANILINYNRKLKVLVLSFNIFITDRSINYLLKMLEHNQILEKFSINNCNLSETSKMKLQEKANGKKIFEIEV